MKNAILKFDRDFLMGQPLRVEHKYGNTSYRKHWHSHNCSGVCILNAERYQLTDHCLFLLTPKDFHEIITDRRPEANSYIISFNEQSIDDSIFSAINDGPFFLPELPEETAALIRLLHSGFAENQKNRSQYLQHLLNCILIHVLDKGNRLSLGKQDIPPMIRDSISIMLQAPGEEHSLSRFAQIFGVSSSYFSYLFHQSTGISFKQYLTVLRMEYAKRLLEERNMSILDVGCECGYRTPSQFIRSFKAFTGMTPSAYRNEKEKGST